MNATRLLSPLALILLLGAAAAAPTGLVESSHVEVASAGRATADLGALFLDGAPSIGALGDDPTLPDPDLGLVAGRLNVTIDRAPARVGPINQVEGEPEKVHDGPGRLQGVDVRDGHHLWITPLDPAHPPRTSLAYEDCAGFRPAERSLERRTPSVSSNRGEIAVQVAGHANATACAPSTLVVEGDLGLVAWEWDLRLGDGRLLRSGVDRTGPEALGAGSAEEVYVEAHDARLEIPLTPGTYRLYLDGARVQAGHLRLHDAYGTLPGVAEPNLGGVVDLYGTFEAGIEGRGVDAPFLARITGSTQKATVDGQPLAVAVPTPPTPAAPPPVGLLATVLAVALAAGAAWYLFPVLVHERCRRRSDYVCDDPAQTLPQRRAVGVTLLAERALHHGNADRALRLAQRSRVDNPAHGDALIIEARAIIERARRIDEPAERMAKHELAGHVLNEAAERIGTSPCTARLSCAVAELSLVQHNPDGARASIAIALGHDEAYTRRFLRAAGLRHLLSDDVVPGSAYA